MVTLSNAVQGGVNVDAQTSDGTAVDGTAATVADSDYTAGTRTLEFEGTAGETETFTVQVGADGRYELDEQFTVTLSNVAAQGPGVVSSFISVVGSPATGTIQNDDSDIIETGTAGNDTWTITATDSNSGKFQLGGGPEISFSGIDSVSFSGLEGDDKLVIINPAGDVFKPANGILFEGGSGSDSLVLNGGTVNTLGFSYTNANDGFVDYDGSRVITYTGLEPLTNTGTATDIIFQLPSPVGGNLDVRLSDEGFGADPDGNTANMSAIDGSTFEFTQFTNPSGSLTIAGSAGADTINIEPMDVAFAANVIVDAGAGEDTINLRGTTGAGTYTINAGTDNDTINVGNKDRSLDDLDPDTTINIHGNDPANGDVLNINDQGDADVNTYTVTSTTVARAGSPIVTYDTVEELNLWGGTGGDTINVVSTLADPALTNIDSGPGNDTYNITADGLGGTNVFGGGEGNDTFDLNITANVGGTSLTIQGDAPAGGDGASDARDRLNINDTAAAARTLTFDYDPDDDGNGDGDLDLSGFSIPIQGRLLETVVFTGDAANDDQVVVQGTVGDDDLTAVPLDANSALVFLSGNPWDGPAPSDADTFFEAFPGMAENDGSNGPDLLFKGLKTDAGLAIDGREGTNRLYVYGTSEQNHVQAASEAAGLDIFGFGDGVLIPGSTNVLHPATPASAFDEVLVRDTDVRFVNDVGLDWAGATDVRIRVNLVTASFVQPDHKTFGLIVNTGFEPAASLPIDTSAVEVADDVKAELSTKFSILVNGGEPDDARAPDGDQLSVRTFGEANFFADKSVPPVVSVTSSGPFGVGFSSIESAIFSPGNGVVNLIGDNNNPAVDQNDSFVVLGKDVDGVPFDGAFQELEVSINGSSPIGIDGVRFLNVFGDDRALTDSDLAQQVELGDVDTLELTPYADNSGLYSLWGVDVFFNAGNPQQGGAQQDLLIYHTAQGLGGDGSVSEDIVIQPSGPETGEVRVANAANGEQIVTISYTANLDIVVLDDDGATSDSDTLTLRGTNLASPATSGTEVVTVDLSAAGDADNPMVVVEDAAPPDPSQSQLYRLRRIENLSVIRLELLAGDDRVSVTAPDDGSVRVAINVDGGDGSDRLSVEDAGLGDLTLLRTSPDGRSGSITVGTLAPVVFSAVEHAGVPANDLPSGGTGTDGLGRVIELELDPFETNDSWWKATSYDLLSRTHVQPTIDPGGDEDWYEFTVPVDSSYRVTLLFDTFDEGELVLEIYKSDGTPLLDSSSNPVAGSPIADGRAVTVTLDGNTTYYARIRGATDNVVNQYDLRIVDVMETFDDGVADDFRVVSGAWTIDNSGDNGRYRGAADSNENAIAVWDETPAGDKEVQAIFNAEDLVPGARWCNAFIVFDYSSPTDFKFAGAFVGRNAWVIGQWPDNQDCDSIPKNQKATDQIDVRTDYRMKVELVGNAATLMVYDGSDWQEKVEHTFLAPFDGKVGLFTRNGIAWFDDFVDPDPSVHGEEADPSPENSAPVARDDVATTGLSEAVRIDALSNDTDADGDPLTPEVVTPPAHGIATIGHDDSVTYTPEIAFQGRDSFTYFVNDGTVDSNTATVFITVDQPNRAPAATDDTANTDEDTPVTIHVLANDSDLDNDLPAVSAVGQADHGTVAKDAGGKVVYTPHENFNGADTFTYQITDGRGGLDTATVTINVISVPDDPLAESDQAHTAESANVTIDVLRNDYDPDGTPCSLDTVGDGAHGATKKNTDGTVSYTPDAGYNGSDVFAYTITDGNGGSASGTVTVSIGGLSVEENFDGVVADVFRPQTGKWSVSGNRYLAERQTVDENVVSLLQIDDPLPSSLEFQVTFNADPVTTTRWSNAFIVFDYKSPTDYKFAGAFVGINLWTIGRMTPRGYVMDTTLREPIESGTDYRLRLLIEGSTATLLVDGDTRVSHTYSDSFQDGDLGLATLRGNASFDDLSVEEI